MEKYNHAKSYHAFAALALSFTMLKATELKVNLSEERWFSRRLKVIYFKDIKLTKDQEDLVDQLSQGMSDDHKESVIRGIRKVKPDQLKLFINTLRKLLSQNIYVNDKEEVLRGDKKFNPCFSLQEIMRFSKDSLTKVVKLLHFYKDEDDEEHIASIIQYLGAMNPDHYTDTFVNTVNQLCQEMNTDDKLELIKTMGKIPSDRYTNAFINTVNQLCQGINANGKLKIIKTMGKIPPDRYTDAFINTVDQLCLGINADGELKTIVKKTEELVVNVFFVGNIESYKNIIIEKIGNIPPDRYTDYFISTVNYLKNGMNELDKIEIIEAVGRLCPDQYLNLINTFKELSQGMNHNDKIKIINALINIDLDQYATNFINVVHQLSLKMDGSHKLRIIEMLSEIHSDRYTDAFINLVHQLSNGENDSIKIEIIEEVGQVDPNWYPDFMHRVHQLAQGMYDVDKLNVIDIVKKFDFDRYPAAFIDVVHQHTQGINSTDKLKIIESIEKIHPDLYPFLENFIKQYPSYFYYVPIRLFLEEISLNMTPEALEALVCRLHNNYYNQAPRGTPQGLAFEIHDFSKQHVVGEMGEKQKFNQAVLEHIQKSIEGPSITYDIVLGLLKIELETLKKDPLKSSAINQKVYNWTIQNNKDQQDKDAITAVVTYLDQKDSMREKLATWLYAFMDESQKAYDSLKSHSCVQGVKERVITSLRSAIPEGDSALQNLFYQAEIPLIIAAKSKKLTDYEFWARKLQANGIKSTTTQADAKVKFNDALNEYFEGINDAHVSAEIEATLDAFEDSQSDCEDGLWSKIKAELLKFEQRLI